MSTKIISRIFGGLGNQLFCYAAARRLALVNDAELVIDDISGFQYDYEYRRNYQLCHFNIPCRKVTYFEQLEPYSRQRRYFKRRLNQRMQFLKRTYIMQEGLDFDPRMLHIKPQGTLYLEGYWQSEDYFKDVAETIRRELQIMPPTDADNLFMRQQIRAGTGVAVHVRFFDKPHTNGINNVSVDYYNRAIEMMERLSPVAHYFIFSDQPEAVRACIPLPASRFTIVAHNQSDEKAYADLWLMTHCQHFIIANSTFSWWGAWLATNANKQVIAPGLKLEATSRVASWGFEGLLPLEWIKL